MKIDILKAEDGMRQVFVNGICGKSPQRLKCISDAIKSIQENPKDALSLEFIGVKQYSGFGDQRCDCQYGMGPRHGCIVFRIGRHKKYVGEINENAIYYLECERDFITNDTSFNLYETIEKWRKSQFTQEEMLALINKQDIDFVGNYDETP